jgi:hypothetical protein
MNNFQRLMQEEERRTPPPPPRIKNNLGGTMKVYRFLGQVVELYLPRVIDLFILLSGGEKPQTGSRKDPGSGRGPSGPNPGGPQRY